MSLCLFLFVSLNFASHNQKDHSVLNCSDNEKVIPEIEKTSEYLKTFYVVKISFERNSDLCKRMIQNFKEFNCIKSVFASSFNYSSRVHSQLITVRVKKNIGPHVCAESHISRQYNVLC